MIGVIFKIEILNTEILNTEIFKPEIFNTEIFNPEISNPENSKTLEYSSANKISMKISNFITKITHFNEILATKFGISHQVGPTSWNSKPLRADR